MIKHGIIIGAQRSGTTYLYKILEDHPQVCMSLPIRPEPKYFLNKETNSLNLDNYHHDFFKHAKPSQKIYIEKSTSYYENETSAKLISSLIPKTKIIFILRNPVYRALSNYFFSLNHGLEVRNLKEVFIGHIKPPDLKHISVSVNPFNYLERGIYHTYIESYRKYFPLENIKILLFEELLGDIDKIGDVYSFLGVKSNYIPSNLLKTFNDSKKVEKIPFEVLYKLKDFYKYPIERLEEILDRDLSLWK